MPTQTQPYVGRSETYRPAVLNERQLQDFDETGFYIARGLFSVNEMSLIRETFMQQTPMARWKV